MIRARIFPFALGTFAAVALSACDGGKKLEISALDDWMPGKPKRADQWRPITDITDGAKIYAMNCLGCHSIGGEPSPVIALNNPTYLAVIPPETLKNLITNGVPGTRMPAFVESKGGSLTEKQIDILVAYILEHKKPIEGPLPPYSAPPGNAAAGQALYSVYVESLKKTAPASMFTDGFLTNPAFLGLLTDQYLRSLVIAGTPELGIPNYREAIPGRPLSDADIADLVAWLISNRKNEFGQPLTTPNP